MIREKILIGYFLCRFPLALSRFSARFEELDNRLFLLAGREYYLQVGERKKNMIETKFYSIDFS
jgi:hypothetical protein